MSIFYCHWIFDFVVVIIAAATCSLLPGDLQLRGAAPRPVIPTLLFYPPPLFLRHPHHHPRLFGKMCSSVKEGNKNRHNRDEFL
jgi:hypothetical protein